MAPNPKHPGWGGRRTGAGAKPGRRKLPMPEMPGVRIVDPRPLTLRARDYTHLALGMCRSEGNAAVLYSMDEAAARLHKSRRWLQDWLRDHPVDGRGEPFYSPLGRTKTFDDNDLERIRAS